MFVPQILPELLTLSETFKHYFKIVPALSDALRDEVYRIRHQVYCEELGYEAVRSDRRESDEYDRHSVHLLIRSVQASEFVGCIRMIKCRPENLDYPLPFEKTCQSGLDRSIMNPATLPRGTIAEVSRLAVIGRYRNRRGEHRRAVALSDKDFDMTKTPRFPYIPVSLYLGIAEVAHLHGINTCFVLTETRLASHFHKLGFRIQTIGTPVDLHGPRVPSMMSPRTVIANLKPILRPLYHTIAADVAENRLREIAVDKTYRS